MSYLHIPNLYKDPTILMFREVCALEKINGCLKKGTLVRLVDGLDLDRPIEQIQPGDSVLSYNTDRQQFQPAVVEDVVIQERDVRLGWMEITLKDGRSVICTEDHPFYTTNRGWVTAANLNVSDDILTTEEKGVTLLCR